MGEKTDIVAERYVIQHRMAVGGMAEVFAAQIVGAHGFTKRVAIKRIAPEISLDPMFQKQFVAEAQTTASLKHPNIVSVDDFGLWGDNLFLAMEYVDGGDLGEIIDGDGCVTEAAALQIMLSVAQGLSYAHSTGVIHRDLSPGNILISKNGAVKIADFGIAVSSGVGSELVGGKKGYAAPEVWKGEETLASDIYSFGVIGREVFGRVSGSKLSDSLSSLWNLCCQEQPSQRRITSKELVHKLSQAGLQHEILLTSSSVAKLFEQSTRSAVFSLVDNRMTVAQSSENNFVATKSNGLTRLAPAKRKKIPTWIPTAVLAVGVMGGLLASMQSKELFNVPAIYHVEVSPADSKMQRTGGDTFVWVGAPESVTLSHPNFLAATLIPKNGVTVVELESKFRTVLVTSEPEGAKVVVDQKVLGLTPLKILVEKSKEKMIGLEKESYQKAEVAVANSTTDDKVFRRLSKVKEKVRFGTAHFLVMSADGRPSWGEVFLGGKKIARAPTPTNSPLRLPVGSHKLTIRNPTSMAKSVFVQKIERNKNHRRTVTLR